MVVAHVGRMAQIVTYNLLVQYMYYITVRDHGGLLGPEVWRIRKIWLHG